MITLVMLAKIRRMHLRDGLSLREIAKRTGLSRNTIRRWLRSGQSEPVYPRRVAPSRIDPYRLQLETWLRADSHRSRHEQRTAKVLFAGLLRMGAGVRRCQDDRRAAQPHHPPLPHPGNRQRLLAAAQQLRHAQSQNSKQRQGGSRPD